MLCTVLISRDGAQYYMDPMWVQIGRDLLPWPCLGSQSPHGVQASQTGRRESTMDARNGWGTCSGSIELLTLVIPTPTTYTFLFWDILHTKTDLRCECRPSQCAHQLLLLLLLLSQPHPRPHSPDVPEPVYARVP